jgi:hypothetical protein
MTGVIGNIAQCIAAGCAPLKAPAILSNAILDEDV